MNPYSGTKTEKNLLEAFSGESQARNKYTYFASVAKKQGYEQIAGPQQIYLFCVCSEEAGIRADRCSFPEDSGQRERAREALVQGTGDAR